MSMNIRSIPAVIIGKLKGNYNQKYNDKETVYFNEQLENLYYLLNNTQDDLITDTYEGICSFIDSYKGIINLVSKLFHLKTKRMGREEKYIPSRERIIYFIHDLLINEYPDFTHTNELTREQVIDYVNNDIDPLLDISHIL